MRWFTCKRSFNTSTWLKDALQGAAVGRWCVASLRLPLRSRRHLFVRLRLQKGFPVFYTVWRHGAGTCLRIIWYRAYMFAVICCVIRFVFTSIVLNVKHASMLLIFDICVSSCIYIYIFFLVYFFLRFWRFFVRVTYMYLYQYVLFAVNKSVTNSRSCVNHSVRASTSVHSTVPTAD